MQTLFMSPSLTKFMRFGNCESQGATGAVNSCSGQSHMVWKMQKTPTLALPRSTRGGEKGGQGGDAVTEKSFCRALKFDWFIEALNLEFASHDECYSRSRRHRRRETDETHGLGR